MGQRNHIIVSVLIILISFQVEIRSQCPVTNVVLHSQAEVDEFGIDYPSCVVLDVHLKVEGADITNLDALINIEALDGGALFVENELLTNFNGLNNVERILFLSISSNPSIVNFEGLNQVSHIEGGLEVEFNPSLQGFSGLELLDSIGGLLFIYNNTSITEITALQNLDYIGGNLILNLSPQLSFCSIRGFCDYLSNPNGNFLFGANGTGCNSQSEILNNCGSCWQDNIWQGPAGGSWHNQNNWSLSEIPTDCHNVIIPAGSDLKVLSGMTADAFTLYVDENAIFDTEAHSVLNVMIK